MKNNRLLDPTVETAGATAPTTQVVTHNQMSPQEPIDDGFLDDTKPPEVVPPVEKPAETVVVDPTKTGQTTQSVAPQTYTQEQVAALLRSNTPQPVPVAKPTPVPLTPEQLNARLNTFKASDQDVSDIQEGGPKALAAFNRMGEGMVKNAVTVAGIIIQDEVRKLQAWAQPHIEFAQAQQQNAAQAQYFQDNPAHVGLEPLIAQVAQQMVGEKFKGNPSETLKEVGKRVDTLVARLKIPVTQTPPTAGAAGVVQKPATSRMSTVSTGGQGGAGGAGGGGPADPEAGIWS